MRDRGFWETWLRSHASALRDDMSSVRDWYRAAGVSKGERRAFRAAMRRLGEFGGRRLRRRSARAEGSGRAEPPRTRRGGDRWEAQREGRLRMTREGRAIVVPDSAGDPAIRVPGHALAGALPKDRVVVRLERRRGGAPPRGKVVRVVERGIREFVGRYTRLEDRSFVRLRDREADLLLSCEVPRGAEPATGELVLAEIAEYPSSGRDARARIVRALGMNHTMETLALAVTSVRGIPVAFSDGTLREADGFPQTVRIGPAHTGKGAGAGPARIDQRALPFVTIDGEDAKDFDDAVCLVHEHGRERLLVAIADVSRYVDAGGEIDRDAYARGTSVYFPDRCIPMLPPSLSEGVCSLMPGRNRLTITVDIPFSAQGRPMRASFYPSIIRSRAKLTYDLVHAFLSGTSAKRKRRALDPEIGTMLRRMEVLAGRLTRARSDRGALDFDLPEAKIVVEDRLPTDVKPVPRWESHRLIEEFMLLANTEVAEFLAARNVPFLYRIHEPPAKDRMEEFEDAAAKLLKRERGSERRDPSARLRWWVEAARGGRYERQINLLMLRSLMLARYAPEAKGHFGLALSRYTHFTSPIRRYPDLVVHRALKAALGDATFAPCLRTLSGSGQAMGAHLSGCERKAADAERDLEQRAKALYLASRTDEVFPAAISSVTGYGFYVELADLPVEGFVAIATVRDDQYRFSADRSEWRGVVRKARFSLGDRLRVRLRRADPDRGEIDFLFIEKLPDSP